MPLLVLSQSSYYDYASSDKTIIQEDDFNNNSLGWSLAYTGDFIRKIENGHMYLESTIDRAKLLSKEFYIDESKDYEIETSIKFITGKLNTGHALLWGKTPEKDYGFYFTGQRSYKISKYDGGYVNITDFITSDEVKAYAYNILTIRKVNNKMYFFINKTLIHTMDAQPFFGQRIGFQVGGKSIIHVDYLKFVYLKPKSSVPKVPEVIQPINHNSNESMTYNWINSKSTELNFYDDFNDNSKGWGVGKLDYINRAIENSYYLFESFEASYYSSTLPFYINESRNFQIETAIKIISGSNSIESGLIWGMEDKSSFRYCFARNGKYTMYKFVNGTVIDILDYTMSNNYKKYDYNILTLRKYNNKLYFFFNKELVHTMPYESFFGNRMGYLVAKNTSMKIDYLKIIYFD